MAKKKNEEKKEGTRNCAYGCQEKFVAQRKKKKKKGQMAQRQQDVTKDQADH